MTDADIKKVVSMWNSGVPIYQIARTLPYSEKIANLVLKELRENGTLPERRTKAENIEVICEAYRNGEHDLERLSKMFCKTVGCIATYLNKGGIKRVRAKRYKTSRAKSDKTNAIVEQIKSGRNIREIANEYGVSRQYVYELKNNMGEEYEK